MKPNRWLFILLVVVALVLSHATMSLAAPKKRLRVGIRTGTPPLCFLDTESNGGKLRGMAIDIVEQVGRLLKTRIVYDDSQKIGERREKLQAGVVDAIIFIRMQSSGNCPFAYIPLNINLKRRFFINNACKTVVCHKDLAGKRVGILAVEQDLPDLPRESEIVPVSSELEALKKLDRNEIEAFLSPSELVAEYLIQKERLSHVVRVGMVSGYTPLAIAVRGQDRELFNKLSNAITILEQKGVLLTIKEKWFGRTYPNQVRARYIKRSLIAVGLFVLLIALILLWNHQLQRRIRTVTQDLQISESKSKALIELSPDMIFVINADGDILLANKKARQEITGEGYGPAKLSKLSNFTINEDRTELENFIAHVFSQGQSSREFRVIDSARNIRELSITASLIISEHPHQVGPIACFFARDVTERNRIERDLVQADRMAIIGQMAAGFAHEINNPLGIVKANLELIASQGWFAEDANEFIEAIRRNTDRAGKITKNLLAVTKPVQAVMTEINLQSLMDKTLEMVRPQLKKVVVRKNYICEAPVVYGDHAMLQQVLVNIFLNARTAMKNTAAPVLTVSCCSNPKEAMARIEICDNGVGIKRPFLSKIFEPFFTTHAKEEGFGLGMFISQRIVERHNGIIFAESDAGKNTLIVVELPLAGHLEETRNIE